MDHFLLNLTKGIITAVFSLGSLISPAAMQSVVKQYVDPAVQDSLATQSRILGAAPQFTAGKLYTLYGGGITSSDTSIRLTSFTKPVSNQTIVTADLVGGAGDQFYGTIEPTNNSRKELVGCTAVTQNSDGSATLTGCTRGLQFSYPYTSTSTLKIAHSGGARFILSNSPQLYQSIIQYVASTSYSGVVDAAPTIKGIVEVATGQEAASTTATGAGNTSAPLVLTSSISTSTRPASGNYVVVTQASGIIHPNLVASSTNLSISTLLVSQGTTTLNSTSTRNTAGSQLFKFGGTGADGALTVSSGLTTIDLGSASVFIKNYSSIAITGTGAVTFSNPATTGTKIIFLVSGNVTLSSSVIPNIDASSTGSTGGTAPGGTGGTVNVDVFDATVHAGAASVAGVAYSSPGLFVRSVNDLYRRYVNLSPGSGGGGGASGTGTGGGVSTGVGGRGGGAFYMEVGGVFTDAVANGISTVGAAGALGGGIKAGGGGGGAGGPCLVLYNVAGTVTGTCNDAGGAGGNGGASNGNGGSAAGGGGGGHVGGAGGTGSTDGANLCGGGGGGGANISAAGSPGSNCTAGAGAASTGGLILKNLWF